jgi:putative DNA primase/helicase
MDEIEMKTGPPIDPKEIKIGASGSRPSDNKSGSDPPEKSSNKKSIDTNQHDPPKAFFLDDAKPLDTEKFPNQRTGSKGKSLPTTIPNLIHMLSEYGITVRYDVIKKKLLINIPGSSGCPDNVDNSSLAQINSLATLNDLSVGLVPSFVEAIGDRNQFNPVADWITSKPWDGKDRLPVFYDTLVVREDFPKSLKEILIKRWLLSAVAAALMPSGFRARGVLTLQGPQSIGKTAWVSALVPDAILRDAVIKLDHHLDAGNKDSQISAISHWVVEIGELDSSFKKDIARLKGFISSDRDKLRKPYARAQSEYQRRTVFCATVNDPGFLVDDSGNTRWWTIPVTSIDYNHDINMQQVFAQLAVVFHKGEPWWLTEHEEQWLEEQNKDHRRVSVIRERVMAALDLDMPLERRPAMSSIEVLRRIGIDNPTNPQCKECCGVLREHLGEPRKNHGQMKWRVPLHGVNLPPPLNKSDDDY